MRPVAVRHAALASLLALAACGAEPQPQAEKAAPAPAETPAPASPATPSLALAVEGEGLRLFNSQTGAASPIPFGADQTQTITAIERLRGQASKGENPECGAGPVQFASWGDGLSLTFQDGRFAGWGLGLPAAGKLSTASGIGPGSTRQEMEAVYADVTVMPSSLGQEFRAGGFFGVLEGAAPAAKVTAMWAGVACIAR